MLKLIKLELQRINLRPYIISSAICSIVLLVFTYFIAYVAQLEQEVQFMSYGNIFLFTGAISILFFGILSATMYAKLIIEEYSGKRLALLFSYPVGRKKIFTAKVLIVSIFVILSMILSTALSIFVFYFTESLAPIVSDTMTSSILIKAFGDVLVSLVSVSAIGMLAMYIGFIRNSVPAALISSFIFLAIYGNMVIGKGESFNTSWLIIGVSLLAIIIIFIALSHKINHMEVE